MKESTEKLTIESGGILDAKLATAGFYPPQIATASLPAFATVEGMVVYNATTNKLNFAAAAAWRAVTSA